MVYGAILATEPWYLLVFCPLSLIMAAIWPLSNLAMPVTGHRTLCLLCVIYPAIFCYPATGCAWSADFCSLPGYSACTGRRALLHCLLQAAVPCFKACYQLVISLLSAYFRPSCFDNLLQTAVLCYTAYYRLPCLASLLAIIWGRRAIIQRPPCHYTEVTVPLYRGRRAIIQRPPCHYT